MSTQPLTVDALIAAANEITTAVWFPDPDSKLARFRQSLLDGALLVCASADAKAVRALMEPGQPLYMVPRPKLHVSEYVPQGMMYALARAAGRGFVP